jgi:hypothetical protein
MLMTSRSSATELGGSTSSPRRQDEALFEVLGKKWIEHTNFSHIVQYNAKELSETRVYAEQMQCYNG